LGGGSNMSASAPELDWTVNKLILGDNLEILKTMDDQSVDLIYLDPPFFSNRNYEVIWGDEGEILSFQDRWAGGIDYIEWLKAQVVLFRAEWVWGKGGPAGF
jgi:DNA modification methylase